MTTELLRLLMGWEPFAIPDHGFVRGDHVSLSDGYVVRVARVRDAAVVGRRRYRGAGATNDLQTFVNRLDRMALLVFASGLAAWLVILGLLALVWLLPRSW